MSNEDSYKYLHCLLSCFLLNNQLYELSKTPYFKREIKYHTNRLADLLGKQIDQDMVQLWGIADEQYETLMKDQDELMRLIGRQNPNHVPLLKTIMEMFDEDYKGTCDKLGINIVET